MTYRGEGVCSSYFWLWALFLAVNKAIPPSTALYKGVELCRDLVRVEVLCPGARRRTFLLSKDIYRVLYFKVPGSISANRKKGPSDCPATANVVQRARLLSHSIIRRCTRRLRGRICLPLVIRTPMQLSRGGRVGSGLS